MKDFIFILFYFTKMYNLVDKQAEGKMQWWNYPEVQIVYLNKKGQGMRKKLID